MAITTAIQSGCPPEIANLVFALYSGDRYLSVHSAFSQACGGNSGLIAGCGFAVHILAAFLRIGHTKWRANIRTYVDDITLSCTGPSPHSVVRTLGEELPRLKDYLISKHMVTNTTKEQLYSPYQEGA
jgi:hypothetical protein